MKLVQTPPSCDCVLFVVVIVVACGGWELQKWQGVRRELCRGSGRKDKSPGK